MNLRLFVFLSDDGMLCTSRQQVIDQRYPVVSTYLLKERGTCIPEMHFRNRINPSTKACGFFYTMNQTYFKVAFEFIFDLQDVKAKLF